MVSRLDLDEATACIQQGGIIAFPTETSFGIGCRAFDARAVQRVVAAKGRPDGQPLPILVPDVRYLRNHELESPLMALAEAFWPGALTLVVPAFPGLPSQVSAGTNMVGVRMSGHPIAQALVERVGEPIVGTSANRTGEPAAKTAAEVDASGIDGLDGLIEGNGAVGGGASTVVGLVNGDLIVHRHGPITEIELRLVWSQTRGAH
jgi:L-threonylcarbamoyladenylate synthase